MLASETAGLSGKARLYLHHRIWSSHLRFYLSLTVQIDHTGAGEYFTSPPQVMDRSCLIGPEKSLLIVIAR